MIQLQSYLNEITNFLRTLTIKNTLVANQMLDAWVNAEYKDLVSDNLKLHPYYRNMMGEYILLKHGKSLKQVIGDLYDTDTLFVSHDALLQLPEEITDTDGTSYKNKDLIVSQVLNVLFPLTSEIDGRVVPNKYIYRYENEIPFVNSFDTKQKIPFISTFLSDEEFKFDVKVIDYDEYNNFVVKQIPVSLKKHPNTATVYKIPQSRYIKLLQKYKKESGIIKAIAYPISFDDLVSAQNFSILNYDISVFEENEQQSMINCVSNMLDMIKTRYAIEGFRYENLYAQAHEYIVWSVLYLALFVQRIMNIKTGNAHSYHIWSYLKSHGFEDYRSVLSTKQQKFLYKNYPYLNKYKGTQHALEILTYVLLNMQHVSLQGKNLMQETQIRDEEGHIVPTTDTAEKYPTVRSIQIAYPELQHIEQMKNEVADQLWPDNVVRFEDILHYLGKNAGMSVWTDKHEYEQGKDEDIDVLYLKEQESLLEYQDEYNFNKSTSSQSNAISTSTVSHRNTKLLEFVNSDSQLDLQSIYTKFIGEALVYYASRGDLKFVVPIQLTNSPRVLTLQAADWIGLLFYAISRSTGLDAPYDHLSETYIGLRYYAAWRAYKEDTGNDVPLITNPPDVDVEWPIKEGETPETFYWGERKYFTSQRLAYYASVYDVVQTITTKKSTFISEESIVDNEEIYKEEHEETVEDVLATATIVPNDSVDPMLQEWKITPIKKLDKVNPFLNSECTLRYNTKRKWWNILDKSESIVYHTPVLNVPTDNISDLEWYDANGKKLSSNSIKFRVRTKEYVIDKLLKPHESKFYLVSDFSKTLHQQAYNFIIAYLSVNHDESAINRALYDTIISKKCVNDRIEMSKSDYVLNGKTFEDYICQMNVKDSNTGDDLVVLRNVLNSYDESPDAKSLYGYMADAIITELLPESREWIIASNEIRQDKYNRLIKLFKSMTSYNLAYLEPKFNDIICTKVSVNNSDYTQALIHSNIETVNTTNSSFVDTIKQTVNIRDNVQKTVGLASFKLCDSSEDDILYKNVLLSYISRVKAILQNKRVAKAKRKQKLMKIFDNEQVVENIMNLSNDIIDTIHAISRSSRNDGVYSKIVMYDCMSNNVSTTTITQNLEPSEICLHCGYSFDNQD